MNVEEIKLLVELTSAKVEILKLRAAPQSWQCWIDDKTKEQLAASLLDIAAMLDTLRAPPQPYKGPPSPRKKITQIPEGEFQL